MSQLSLTHSFHMYFWISIATKINKVLIFFQLFLNFISQGTWIFFHKILEHYRMSHFPWKFVGFSGKKVSLWYFFLMSPKNYLLLIFKNMAFTFDYYSILFNRFPAETFSLPYRMGWFFYCISILLETRVFYNKKICHFIHLINRKFEKKFF